MAHVYLVSHQKCVVGIFSNRTWMIGSIGKLFENCHIKGQRKNLAVTASSIGVNMPNGFIELYDNDTDEIEFRIWDLNINSVNPQYKERILK